MILFWFIMIESISTRVSHKSNIFFRNIFDSNCIHRKYTFSTIRKGFHFSEHISGLIERILVIVQKEISIPLSNNGTNKYVIASITKWSVAIQFSQMDRHTLFAMTRVYFSHLSTPISASWNNARHIGSEKRCSVSTWAHLSGTSFLYRAGMGRWWEKRREFENNFWSNFSFFQIHLKYNTIFV